MIQFSVNSTENMAKGEVWVRQFWFRLFCYFALLAKELRHTNVIGWDLELLIITVNGS